jgi:hypothetical protein
VKQCLDKDSHGGDERTQTYQRGGNGSSGSRDLNGSAGRSRRVSRSCRRKRERGTRDRTRDRGSLRLDGRGRGSDRCRGRSTAARQHARRSRGKHLTAGGGKRRRLVRRSRRSLDRQYWRSRRVVGRGWGSGSRRARHARRGALLHGDGHSDCGSTGGWKKLACATERSMK